MRKDPDMTPTTPANTKPRVLVLLGPGLAHHARWPSDLDVTMYEISTTSAARAGEMIRRRSVDYVIVSSKGASRTLRELPRDGVPVLAWNRSIGSLCEGIHELLGIPQPALEEQGRPRLALVSEASRFPDRRPAWTDEQRQALLVAFESAVEWPRVVEGYLDLTQELDVPMRTQAELKAELARLRGQTPDAFDAFAFLHGVLATATTAAAVRLAREWSVSGKHAARRLALMIQRSKRARGVLERSWRALDDELGIQEKEDEAARAAGLDEEQ